MIPENCDDCAFDAGILGQPVWRLNEPGEARAVVEVALGAGVGLIACRGGTADETALEQAGFRCIETLVTFEQVLPQSVQAAPDGVRIATAQDADDVAKIARTAFHSDRWHRDPQIGDDIADAFKSAWARNDVLGRAAPVFLATDSDGRTVGFNAVICRDDTAIIDLIAVAPNSQGRGHGKRLIQAAQSLPVSTLRVGTQGSNVASIRLYAALGLVEVSRSKTWHWTP